MSDFDFNDVFEGPLGGWEPDVHNPDMERVRDMGLNIKREELLRHCARCGKVKPDDGMSGPFGYGPKNNLCWDCWQLPDIEDWLQSH